MSVKNIRKGESFNRLNGRNTITITRVWWDHEDQVCRVSFYSSSDDCHIIIDLRYLIMVIENRYLNLSERKACLKIHNTHE